MPDIDTQRQGCTHGIRWWLTVGVGITFMMIVSDMLTNGGSTAVRSHPPEANQKHPSYAQLIGTWLSLNERETMEIFADGTVRFVNTTARFSDRGDWRFLHPQEDRLRIHLHGYHPGANPLTMRFELTGNELALQAHDEVMRYRRKQ